MAQLEALGSDMPELVADGASTHGLAITPGGPRDYFRIQWMRAWL
jgi:hypothetical protein